MNNKNRPATGFSLIELAIVLFIVTLVMGGVMQYVSAQLIIGRITATRAKQDAIKSALISFIAQNSRLPCPALFSNAVGTPTDGLETTPVNTTTCVGSLGADTADVTFVMTDPPTATPVVVSGEVPWASLGLSHEAALDGYGNRFTYQVSYYATRLSAQTISGVVGASTIHDATPIVLGAATATPPGNQVNDCRQNKGVAYVSASNPCNAVVVIVSHGVNGYGAYTDGGIQHAFPPTVTGLDERANANGTSKFIVKSASGSIVNPYDDFVVALTANDLLSPLTNSGSIQDARAVINLNFGVIKNAVASSVASNMTVASIAAQATDARGNDCVAGTTTTPPNACTYYSKFTYILPPPAFPTGFTVETYGGAISFAVPFSCTPLPCVQNRVLFGTAFPTLLNLPARFDPWGMEIQLVLFNALPTQTLTSPPGVPDAPSNVAYRLLSLGPDRTVNTPDDISVDVSFGELRQTIPTK